MSEHDALHVKVAELAGWKHSGQNQFSLGEWINPSGQSNLGGGLPPLTLDWMHALEHAIPENGYIFFESALKKIVREDWFNGKFPKNLADSFPCHASVSQRARAYIETRQPK